MRYRPPATRPMEVREGGGHGWRCSLLGRWLTLLYFLRTQDPFIEMSGHDYGAPTYERGYWPGVGEVEYEDLTCRRCGLVSRGWTRWYGA